METRPFFRIAGIVNLATAADGAVLRPGNTHNVRETNVRGDGSQKPTTTLLKAG